MADVAKILAARKAAALEAQAAAAREAEEIDRDLKELARITEKYGLVEAPSAVPAPAVPTVQDRDNGGAKTVKMVEVTDSFTSMTMRSRLESAAVIKAAKRPVPLTELYEAIYNRGVRLGGKKPPWVLSAVLGRTEDFVSIRERGWWLKSLGAPPPVSMGELYEKEYGSNAEH